MCTTIPNRIVGTRKGIRLLFCDYTGSRTDCPLNGKKIIIRTVAHGTIIIIIATDAVVS